MTTAQNSNFERELHFSIESEDDLVRSFRVRDQKKLVLPSSLEFPMNVRSYLTWQESSGVYTYLVFKAQNWDLPRGVAFRRGPAGAEAVGGLCSWCHSYGTSEEIGLMSVAMSGNVTRSYLLCQDLRCIEKIEETSMRAGKSPEKHVAELYYRMEKMFENISNYRQD